MSVKVSALVWEMRGCSAIQKLVILKLADHASDDGRNIHPRQKSVAVDCECDVRSVQRVIKWATDEGILVEIPGPKNRPKSYRFCLDSVRQRVRVTESQGDRESGSARQRVVVSTTQSRAINKEPLTNRQLTVIENLPFSSDVFQKTWAEWVQFRREKKQALTPTTIKRQLGQLGKLSEVEAIASIEQSITNGWTGLFPVKDAKPVDEPQKRRYGT